MTPNISRVIRCHGTQFPGIFSMMSTGQLLQESFSRRALKESAEEVDFEFDEQAKSIRRGLMLFSAISLAAAAIHPPTDSGYFEVNAILIKGVVQHPAYVYLFIAGTCFYHLVWFVTYCRALVVKNYATIEGAFTRSLAIAIAERHYQELQATKLKPLGLSPSFKGDIGRNGQAVVSMEIPTQAFEGIPLKEIAVQDGFFEVDAKHHTLALRLRYSLQDRYKVDLRTHLDRYWRTRNAERMFAVFPIAFGCVSLLAVVLRMSGVL